MLLTSELARIIGFDAQLIFDSLITAVNILVLFAGLSYLLFNPAVKMLTERQNKIKKEITDANAKLEDATKIKAEYEQKLLDVKKEIEQMLDEARKNAKLQSDEILEHARLEALAIVERGNKEIALEKEKAMDDLKSEVVNISTLLASKVVKNQVDKSKADELFNETLEAIGKDTWLG